MPGRSDDHAGVAGQAVAAGRPSAAGRPRPADRSSTGSTALPASARRGRRPQPGQRVGDQRQVLDADRQLGRGVQAVLAGLVVQQVEQRAALAARPAAASAGHRERGADAVLVADGHARVAADAVAEGLLVAEHRACDVSGPAARAFMIHLKPVRVSAYRTPCAAAIVPSSDDDTIVVATSRSSPVVCRRTCSASSPPTSSPVSIRQPPSGGDGDRAAVRVRVVGDHQVGAAAGRAPSARSIAPGLLRVRERDGREVRVRVGLLRHDLRRGEPGPTRTPRSSTSPPTPCSGVYAIGGRGRRRAAARDSASRYASTIAVVEDVSSSSPSGSSSTAADGVDRGGDLRVERRDDLRAVRPVDLVAVVAGRVVAGRHHDARDRAGVAHGERRARASAAARRTPGRRSPAPPSTAAVSSANTSDSCRASNPMTRRPPRVAQAGGEPGGGAHHRDPVHPVRPGAQLAAQPGRAELQPGPEPGGAGPVVARVEDRAQLGAGLRVGVLRQPVLGLRAKIAHTVVLSTRTSSPGLRIQSLDDGGEQAAHALGGGPPGRQHLLVVERLAGQPGGDVGHQGDPEDLGAALAGRDRLQDGRHPDQVGAQRPQHPDLGGRLVRRAAERRVHALGAARGSTSLARARSRGEYASVRSRNVAPVSGFAPVRFRWSEISTGSPTCCSSGRRAPAALVSTIVLTPAASAVRTRWTTASTPRPSYRCVRPRKTRARPRRSRRRGSARRGRRRRAARSPAARSPGSRRRARPARRRPGPSPTPSPGRRRRTRWTCGPAARPRRPPASARPRCSHRRHYRRVPSAPAVRRGLSRRGTCRGGCAGP